MEKELIERYARPAPRYTSYPTANHFTGAIRPVQYIDWLAALPSGTELSLYLHVPFCQSLCWYCACTTQGARRYEPVARYVAALETEIRNVAALLDGRFAAGHIHWGGGSPSILRPDDIGRIAALLRRSFDIGAGAEHAVEIDPRHLTPEQVRAFAEAGATRVSLGVQDFDPAVQAAIGRHQDVALTRRAVELFRKAGVGSVNIDLVYGLPRQTEDSLTRTLEAVIALAPDRIAAFGYAHLPQRVARQRLVDDTAMPGAIARFNLSSRIASVLEGAGYRRIGIDHFARGDDGLAQKPLRRNFQGYTTDEAEVLIGFGASAIGRLPDGYVQNASTARTYERLIATDGLATARGIALTLDDRVRGFAIERLMCDFRLSSEELESRFGAAARPVLAAAAALADRDPDQIVVKTPDGIELTDHGRPFVRHVCAGLDRYFSAAAGGHSAAV